MYSLRVLHREETRRTQNMVLQKAAKDSVVRQ